MKLKIVSDGTPFGTQVIDEQGNPIENVTAIRWEADGGKDYGGYPKVTLEFFKMPVELAGEAAEMTMVVPLPPNMAQARKMINEMAAENAPRA